MNDHINLAINIDFGKDIIYLLIKVKRNKKNVVVYDKNYIDV